MKNLLWVLLSAFAALLYVACDDDGTSAKKSDDGEEVAHVVDTLYVFSKDTVYSVAKDTVYFVDTTHYVDTVVVRDSVYSYGLDGTSCTTSSVGDTAVMIVCGKDTAYVRNGVDALRDEKVCVLENTSKGQFIKCGDFSLSFCAGIDYDTLSFFCYGGLIYSVSEWGKCGSQLYRMDSDFCFGTDVYELCEGTNYDPRLKVCDDGKLMSHCGGVVYDSLRQFCFGADVYELCEGTSYDPRLKVCDDGKLTFHCGGVVYDSLRQYCASEKLFDVWDGTYQSFIDSRDGREYKYVTIGEQIWMAEDLDYNSNSDSITSSWCYTGESVEVESEDCQKGRFYSFSKIDYHVDLSSTEKVRNEKEVCPIGWHTAYGRDWSDLNSIIKRYNPPMIALGLENGGKNLLGFTAKPSGYYDMRNKKMDDVGVSTYYISLTSSICMGEIYAFSPFAVTNTGSMWVSNSFAYPVRCVKD